MKARRKNRLKNRVINLSITLGTILILFIIYLIVFDNYKKSLRAYKKFTKHDYGLKGIEPLKKSDAVQLWNVHTPKRHPKSSYLNFPKEKQEGTYRIGIFGCSFVEGLGAGNGYDFPTRLQEKFLNEGQTDVEVINFGVRSYGMNRAFYLWNCLGKSYDLDLVIFNVHNFHFHRDRTFVFSPNTFRNIFGRYILDKGQLRFIPVLGEALTETPGRYYTPIPAWRYWRYEAKTPVPFRAVLPKTDN